MGGGVGGVGMRGGGRGRGEGGGGVIMVMVMVLGFPVAVRWVCFFGKVGGDAVEMRVGVGVRVVCRVGVGWFRGRGTEYEDFV